MRKKPSPADAAIFANLPVRLVTMARGEMRLAVHLSGDFSNDLMPLVCLPGYQRNMLDYVSFLKQFRSQSGTDWPIVLIDLAGRGRSSFRKSMTDYTSTADARNVAEVLVALNIHKAIFVGQGHGGQVIMALGAYRPASIAGCVLIDAGPVADSRGLVRLRNNLLHLAALRGNNDATRAAMEQVIAADFPGMEASRIHAIANRTHQIDKNGRITSLFDMKLVERLEEFGTDDVFEPQWALFNALTHADMMLIRTQLTDQLRRETFDEMAKRRTDAIAINVPGQGSPALLEDSNDAGAIADFVQHMSKSR